jgi:hypothetical protein
MISKVIVNTNRNKQQKKAIGILERLVAVLQVLGGYYAIPALLIILVSLGDNTRAYMFPIRAAYALLCGVILVGLLIYPKKCSWVKAQIPLGIFWIAYLSRVVYEGYFKKTDLRLLPEEYLYYAVGMCLVPMCSFFKRQSQRSLELMYATLFWSCLLAVALSIWVYRSLLGTSFGRLGSEEGASVNPLTVAYMASTLLILSLYSVLYSKTTLNLKHIVYYLGMACSILALIMGASRGPIVAVLLCGVIALYCRLKGRAFVRVAVYGFCLLGIGIVGERLADALGSNLAERISYTKEELAPGGADSGRLPVASLALAEFLTSPLVGSGVDVKETKSYPHNLILESFLTTGILGGSTFLVFLVSSIRAALRLLSGPQEYGWIPLLFFAYLVESQLSGAIYMSSVFWTSAALTLTVDHQLREQGQLGHLKKWNQHLMNPVARKVIQVS